MDSALALLAVSIWMPRSEAQQSSDPLRVRSLIVEDASGQPRVVLGAPPGTGDDRNRERVTIVADAQGGAYVRLKQPSTVRRRIGLKGEETITGAG